MIVELERKTGIRHRRTLPAIVRGRFQACRNDRGHPPWIDRRRHVAERSRCTCRGLCGQQTDIAEIFPLAVAVLNPSGSATRRKMQMDELEIKASITVDDAGAIIGIAWPFGSGPDRIGDLIEKGAFNVAVADLPMLLAHDPETQSGYGTK